MVGYLSPVTAVTEAELEALEKQIEQQEAEEVKQAEAKKKKKAEQKRKAEIEVEKKRLVELEKQRQEEQERLAELERKRQKEAKKRAEEEKKEKYNLLIAEAKQAINDKDKELAISKYNEALTITPGDPIANSGIKKASKLKHKVCYEVLGTWEDTNGSQFDIKEDGTMSSLNFPWECADPKNRTIKTQVPSATMTAVLSDDGKCITASTRSATNIWHRPGHVCEDAQPK